jgi:hypothetical protein
MTPEAQRIALAEWEGWKAVQNTGAAGGFIPQSPEGESYYYTLGATPELAILKLCHDYLNDLNAVHELEKRLTPEQCDLYDMTLSRIVSTDWPDRLPDGRLATEPYVWIATAAQRCEALLKTLNLWKDNE